MTERPLISVVIPTYNCARYLPQAIDSILQQSYPHHEIIVVDDGSTDNTQAVIEPYLDKIVYFQQDNQGVSAARNAGLELSQGELVLFLDADDYLSLPTMFAEVLLLLVAKPELDVVHSGWVIAEEEGHIVQTCRPWLELPRLDVEAWFKSVPVCLSAMVFRRPCLEQVGYFDPKLREAEDVDFLLRLSLTGCQFGWLPKITACYRQRQTSLSHSNIPLSIDQGLQVREDLLARPDAPESVRRQKKQILFGYLIWGFNRLLENNCPDQAILDHLAKLLNYSSYPKIEVIYDIVAQSTKFEYLQRDKSEHAARLAVILVQAYPALKQTTLHWWGQVWWWYYLSRQSGEVARMIGPYKSEAVQNLQNYSLAERVRLARLALLQGVNFVYGDGLAPVEVLEIFRRDAELNTARPLYLAYLWRLLKSRQWPAARQIPPKIWHG